MAKSEVERARNARKQSKELTKRYNEDIKADSEGKVSKDFTATICNHMNAISRYFNKK